MTKTPRHSAASRCTTGLQHTADAFRYAACVVKVSKLLTEKTVKVEPRVRSLGTHTLNEMYAMAKQGQSRRRV
jgi:hypothetical protein